MYKGVSMVQITKVEAKHDYVVMEYSTNGITISTRVMEDQERTPQEILEKGYAQLKPHIQVECDRLGIVANHDLPIAVDEVVSIALVGIENVNFIEGQTPIQKSFRCAGTTLYGKTLDLSDVAIFTPSKDMSLEPTESGTMDILVTYEGLTDTRTMRIAYKSLADIQAEADARAVEEAQRVADELAEAERIANLPPTADEKIDDLIDTLLDKGVLL